MTSSSVSISHLSYTTSVGGSTPTKERNSKVVPFRKERSNMGGTCREYGGARTGLVKL